MRGFNGRICGKKEMREGDEKVEEERRGEGEVWGEEWMGKERSGERRRREKKEAD